MGIAIIWIYFHHIAPCGTEGSIYWYIHEQGYTGVDLFILLSGFGMTYALKKYPVKDVKSYFMFELRRFSRIYASFLPITAVIALVDNWTKPMILLRITYIEQFSKNIYIHLWYVGAILLFYLFVPFYYAVFDKRENKKRFTACSMLIVVVASLIARFFVRDDITSAIIVRIPIFFLGIYWGYLSLQENNETQKMSGRYWFHIGLFVVGVAMTYCVRRDWMPIHSTLGYRFSYWFLFPYVQLVFIPALVLITTDIISLVDRNVVGRAFNKAFAYIGTISLEIYCMHEWVVGKCYVLRLDIDTIRWELAAIFIVFFASVGVNRFSNDLVLKHIKKRKVEQ